MTEQVVEGRRVTLRHLPTLLREVSAVRTVGFQDAVDDLGTHTLCGHEVPYSKAQVYAVLQGRHRSERLVRRIAEKRPDLLELRFVAPEVREAAKVYLVASDEARGDEARGDDARVDEADGEIEYRELMGDIERDEREEAAK